MCWIEATPYPVIFFPLSPQTTTHPASPITTPPPPSPSAPAPDSSPAAPFPPCLQPASRCPACRRHCLTPASRSPRCEWRRSVLKAPSRPAARGPACAEAAARPCAHWTERRSRSPSLPAQRSEMLPGSRRTAVEKAPTAGGRSAHPFTKRFSQWYVLGLRVATAIMKFGVLREFGGMFGACITDSRVSAETS